MPSRSNIDTPQVAKRLQHHSIEILFQLVNTERDFDGALHLRQLDGVTLGSNMSIEPDNSGHNTVDGGPDGIDHVVN